MATAKTTIAGGLGLMSGGDTLLINDGTYAEIINDTIPQGTGAGTPTLLQAINNHGAILQPTSSAIFYVIKMDDKDFITLDGIDVNAGSSADTAGIGAFDTTCNGIVIKNCRIRNTSGDFGNGIDGLFVDSQFLNNDIEDCGTAATAHGIYLAFSGNLIKGNRINGCAGYGVHLYNGSAPDVDNNTVDSNVIVGNGLGVSAGGILVGWGTGNVVKNNIVRANQKAIVAFNGSGAVKIYNNTIVDNLEDAVDCEAGSGDSIVKNNIFWGNAVDAIDDDATGLDASNNLATNPDFVNPGANDYHIQAGSDAIGAGVAVAEVTVDFDGVARPDPPAIGAFEAETGGPTPQLRGVIRPNLIWR